MIELVIHGRGGRGSVTLAKLVASVYFRRGKYAQAFAVYGAERMGAPVQAYVRVDDEEITVHNPVTAPDHVVVVDPSLVSSNLAEGVDCDGWIVVNTPQPPQALAGVFPGRKVATVDADSIAVAHCLGTRALPIANTTLLGALARLLGLAFADVEGALRDAGLSDDNREAASAAFDMVRTAYEPGAVATLEVVEPRPIIDFLDERVGSRPTTPTGSWASRRPHAHTLTPLCSEGCPAGNDVRGFVQATARGDWDEALATILMTSPFPGTCGRVCPAPCMATCNRRDLDGPVDVRDIERAVAERGVWSPLGASSRDASVAVVGAGPAGLSAAYHLARLGYQVTVHEARDELGGVLRSGIPEYRLPRRVLDREIDFILGQGVQAKTGQRVDRTVLMQMAHDYTAVFVATGLQTLRSLELDGTADGVVGQGLEFLDAARSGTVDLAGQHVVVVGGGNTAMDAARTALRLGARDVNVVYRRTRAQMPAIAEEVEEALEEGVAIAELTSPLRLRRSRGGTVLVCARTRLGEPDESGRPRAIPVEGDDACVELRCDRLLLALGQGSDLSLLPMAAAESTAGPLHLDDADAPVFLGGDFAGGEGTVTAAIGSGRRAALQIDAALAGDSLAGRAGSGGTADSGALAGPAVVHLNAFPHKSPQKVALLPARIRRRSFAEVRRGLVDPPGQDAVRAEAQRCLSCGACNGCDACVVYCPEGVLHRERAGAPDFDYEFCKGCGLCASACPRGVVFTQAI